ncbi:hypothetical protein [Micromonospora sediminicola]|uniref:hypothetical protein n=1 Tax=Micromonospora sediminicola TaxID=946078 RepID=UPI001146D75D|nr:hypothetical protein [Micromonospora sediminicola]
MGDAARLVAAVVSLVISTGLLLLTLDLVRKSTKTGGAFEISWQPFAFHIKFWAKAPEGHLGDTAGEERPPPTSTSDQPSTSVGELARPVSPPPNPSDTGGGDGG